MTKAELRDEIRARLKAQPDAARQQQSRNICEQVLALPAYQRARTVMCYVALPYEVDTASLMDAALRDGKRVAVPVMDTSANTLHASLIHPALAGKGGVHDRHGILVKGPYGVMQPRADAQHPVAADGLDLIVVPGVAFSRQGQRLGQGKGYYDRFLRGVPRHVPRIGLAFDFQVVEELPVDAHDQSVDQVISG